MLLKDTKHEIHTKTGLTSESLMKRRQLITLTPWLVLSPYLIGESAPSNSANIPDAPVLGISGKSLLPSNNNGYGSKKNFIFYNQLNFKQTPKDVTNQLAPIDVFYANQLWPDNKKGARLDSHYLMEYLSKRVLIGTDNFICLDIEHWPYRHVSAQELHESIQLYLEAVALFRAAYPHARIGIFEFSPTSLYPYYNQLVKGVAGGKWYRAWQQEQENLKPLTDHLDVLFPQLYSRWPDNPAGWDICARKILTEARKIAGDRPVIPFIWPQFWTDTQEIIPGDYWRRILTTVYELCDSAVIWSIYGSAPRWNRSFEWWKETLTFMHSHHIGT